MKSIEELEPRAQGICSVMHGIDPSEWPLSTERVIEIARSFGRDMSLDVLFDFEARGVAERPEAWSAADFLGLIEMLDARRMWLPGHLDERKTPWERALEAARAAGRMESVYEDIRQFDIRHALIMMAESDTRERREQCYVIARALLEKEGITI